ISDETIDVIMSNCVINLSPDKERVYKEAFRVLKNGGRIFVADIVLAKELPDFIKNNTSAYIGCIAGALAKDEYLSIIRKAGFADVQILKETIFPIDFIISEDIKCNISKNTHSSIDLTKNIEDLQKSILSILVSAKKL
ncbi:MAG: methyltransferase domain-containing protein, partial [Actinobacteria bacterium]|nr:methyltransferase domain-containing protein [Actinomycetota bacterium]